MTQITSDKTTIPLLIEINHTVSPGLDNTQGFIGSCAFLFSKTDGFPLVNSIPLPVPILLVISRYEITQGSAVKRMGNATFIITPFKEEELCEKIEQMKKEFNNHEPSGN